MEVLADVICAHSRRAGGLLKGQAPIRGSTGWRSAYSSFRNSQQRLMSAVAGQSSSAVDISVGTRENGLTANALGAMVTWLDTRQLDGNAYTIDRSGCEL